MNVASRGAWMVLKKPTKRPVQHLVYPSSRSMVSKLNQWDLVISSCNTRPVGLSNWKVDDRAPKCKLCVDRIARDAA